MSLLLRQACQKILDDNDLPQYHVIVNEDKFHKQDKHIIIVGECGKELLDIPGIMLTSNRPTKAELDYAAQLFDDFMVIHGGDIRAYVKAKVTLSKFVLDEKYRTDDEWTDLPVCTYEQNGFNISVFINSNRIRFSAAYTKETKPGTPHKTTTISQVDSFKVDIKEVAKAKAYLRKIVKHQKAKEKTEEMKQALSTCNI